MAGSEKKRDPSREQIDHRHLEIERHLHEQALKFEQEQKELEAVRGPVVNHKYNSKISCRNIIHRIDAEMKAKQARLKKAKEEAEAKRN